MSSRGFLAKREKEKIRNLKWDLKELKGEI